MRFFSIVGSSLGCSASGERLVSAARDGDLQEAKALLEDNPRLVKYSTNGVKNSPLHYSAAQGHHEIVTLLLESGIDINLRNHHGQTALMQACQYGHWDVVQTLMLFNTNIHQVDDLIGGTALHLAALNGNTRCIRLVLADYIPSIPNAWDILRKRSKLEEGNSVFNQSALLQVINKPADGGVTALHMAVLNGHVETVLLLLDLRASVNALTVEDGTKVDFVGAGSTPLHYAACGGNAQCCQMLIARGACLTAQNANGLIPLMVARSWNRDPILELLSTTQDVHLPVMPSPYLCLPLMSIIQIARESGWRNSELSSTCKDPCVVCLEGKCTVVSEGCNHAFCNLCALCLCTMNCSTAVARGPPGSVACPLCRAGIVVFSKIQGSVRPKPKYTSRGGSFSPPLGGSSLRSLSCQRFSAMKLNSGLCMGASGSTSPCMISGSGHRSLRNHLNQNQMSIRRSSSQAEGRKFRFFSLNQCLAHTGG